MTSSAKAQTTTLSMGRPPQITSLQPQRRLTAVQSVTSGHGVLHLGMAFFSWNVCHHFAGSERVTCNCLEVADSVRLTLPRGRPHVQNVNKFANLDMEPRRPKSLARVKHTCHVPRRFLFRPGNAVTSPNERSHQDE